MAASWVVVSKATGQAVFETVNRKTADQINTNAYRVIPILEWLQSLNRKVAK
jgi:hypothetical protein